MRDSDALLLRKAASEQDAFPVLMRRHGQAIHAYLARRGGRDAADDLSRLARLGHPAGDDTGVGVRRLEFRLEQARSGCRIHARSIPELSLPPKAPAIACTQPL